MRFFGKKEIRVRDNLNEAPKSTLDLLSAIPDDAIEIRPLESYVEEFSVRYQKEDTFKEMVHDELELSGADKVYLALGKQIRPSWYRGRTDEMVTQCATNLRDKLENLVISREEAKRLREIRGTVLRTGSRLSKAVLSYQLANERYGETVNKKNKALSEAEKELERRHQEEEEIAVQEKARLHEDTDAEKLVEDSIDDLFKRNPFTKVNERGELVFNDQKIITVIEDRVLNEIVRDIERESGHGFMSKLKDSYDGVFSHFGEMRDISELSHMDPVMSLIYSRTKGFEQIQFPYMVARKFSAHSKTSLDTAITLDISRSMGGVKFEAAKRTTLAVSAVMRRLNPKNNTFSGYFSNDVHDCTTCELMRDVKINGLTRTDLALNWLGEKLANSGPSFAYLITDGVPAWGGVRQERCVKETIEAARKFSLNPDLSLRIFHIDPNEISFNIIKRIGEAAGPETRVSAVDSKSLGKDVVRDVANSIGVMSSIGGYNF
jgi:hypothetical protein